MKARLLTLALLIIGAIVLAFVLTAPAVGQGSIIVNGADTVRTETITSSQSLSSTFGIVQPRVILQYANTMRPFSMTAPPGELQILFGQVTPRIIFQYANTNRALNLAVAPAALQTLLSQVSARIILQYANTNRQQQLAYPVALVGDNTPPQITGIASSGVGLDSVKITWNTDEWADSVVVYGTQPGVYTQTVTDALYSKNHAFTFTGLTTGILYYFLVRSGDRSGNTTTSVEYSFKINLPLFLPLIRR
jgi:hypothetical protein